MVLIATRLLIFVVHLNGWSKDTHTYKDTIFHGFILIVLIQILYSLRVLVSKDAGMKGMMELALVMVMHWLYSVLHAQQT